MAALSNPFRRRWQIVRGAPHPGALLRELGLSHPAELADPHLGQPVRTARSSWVRRATTVANDLFIKTYVYDSAGDRLRGACRNTWLARSRAAREWDALAWLRGHGLPAPEPLLVGELRRCGWLHRAVLVTRAFPGQPLDRLLPTLPAPAQGQLGRRLGELVRSLHRLGFRDRNLDLRNLLAQPTDGGWIIAKIDSPRFRLVRPGPADDALARADWQRLLPQLAAFPAVAAAVGDQPPSG